MNPCIYHNGFKAFVRIIKINASYLLGKTVEHDDIVLNGANGYAFGIDFGYKIGNGFAVEYDFSYSSNKVTETISSVIEEAKAKYYTSSLDLIYTYALTEGFALFGKFDLMKNSGA